MDEKDILPWQAVILVGDPRTPRPLDAYLEGRRLICTAQGTRYALAHDLVPEAVVGLPTLFDEATRERLHRGRVRMLTPADDFPETALEFALNYAITTGARDVLILGLIGESLAQSLSHLLVLARAEWGAARLTFVHGPETGYLLRHGETAVIHGSVGDPVTLLPLSPTATEITTQGLNPVQRGATLELGRVRHLTLMESPARVWLGAGRLLVLHRR